MRNDEEKRMYVGVWNKTENEYKRKQKNEKKNIYIYKEMFIDWKTIEFHLVRFGWSLMRRAMKTDENEFDYIILL